MKSDLSDDAFLGGRLQILQPRKGYRAGVDPVLLAASVIAKPSQTVLDLGCGTGVAGLCLAARVQGLQVWGLELQEAYAQIARENAARNGYDMTVFHGDLQDMPDGLRTMQFDHVIANPPYFDRERGTAANDVGRETALGEVAELSAWVKAAAKRAGPKGTVTFIQRIQRLPELLNHMSRHLGTIEVMPLLPREGRGAELCLLRGRKGGRADFKLHPGWILHSGALHEKDGESYTPETSAILREAAALEF